MKALLVGVALLALTVPAAYSQEVPAPEMEGPGQYRVFFAFDRANLSEADRQTIAQAVEDYRRTGTARITTTGHTDTYRLASMQRTCSRAVGKATRRAGLSARR
jgi:outer membrane protein OmpA-like peptidoglycan-associated protein